MKKRIFAAILALIMTLPLLAGLPAASEEGIVVGYSSPAICVNAGEKVDLTKVSVQLEYGAAPVSALTWKDGESTVTSYTPAAKGVYALTASAGGKTRTVYVVAKNANETEYVLYENDFSTAPDMAQFRVIQQPSGTVFGYDEAEGAIYLDSTKNTSDMMRVLLPEFLDSFGDAIYSAQMKITKQLNNSRWCSLVIRQQNVKTTKLPYLQVVSRYNNSADNGLEIAERTSADKWSVTQKGACAGVKGGEYFTLTANFCGSTVTNSVNGTTYLTEKFAPYYEGAMGLQANGSRMTVSHIKVTVNPESRVADKSAKLRDTRDTESNIALAPIIVKEYKQTEDAWADPVYPTVAVFDAELNSSELGVNYNGKFNSIDVGLHPNVILALRVDSKEEAAVLGKYAKSLPICDMYVISSDMSLITAARAECDMLYGMVEVSEYAGDIEKLRSDIVSCGARGVIFTEDFADRETVSYLQDRYLTVWQKTDGSELSTVTAINNGVLGIVTPDIKAAEECFTKYYTKNTLVRTPEIIGHRGIPSKAQENSLAGALAAIENGATMVECDVYRMRDGNVVVMHDSTLDRTTNGTGNTVDQTAESIKKYQIDSYAGAPAEPIPLLEDLLKAFKESGEVLVIELKSSDKKLCAPVVELIKKYEMEKQSVIIAFGRSMIKEIRRIDPGIPVNFLTNSITANEQMSLEISAQILGYVIPMNTAYSPSYSVGTLGTNLFGDLAARGVTVWNWTVNNQSEFNKFFISGIRGMTTNYSDWAANYVEEFGIAVNADGSVELKAVNYKGENVSTSSAELVVVGGEGEYKDGVVTLSEGAQGYFFRLKRNLSNGTAYSVVTPVVLAGNTPAADTTAPETEEAPAPETTEPTVETPHISEADGGCGSIISIPVLALAALGITFIKKRK